GENRSGRSSGQKPLVHGNDAVGEAGQRRNGDQHGKCIVPKEEPGALPLPQPMPHLLPEADPDRTQRQRAKCTGYPAGYDVAEPESCGEYACDADAYEPDVSSRCHYRPEFTPVRTIF